MKVFACDVSLCIGCRMCQISCKDEHCGNDWTPYAKPQPDIGQFWVKVNEFVRGTVGTSPKVKVYSYPVLCMNCEDTPCAKNCTGNAISRRADGLVFLDPKLCNGCKNCLGDCPYKVIYFNDMLNIAQKCTGCAHLLDRGWPIKIPRCVDSCYNKAITFGEEAEMSTNTAGASILHPEYGTKAKVFYKNMPKRFIAGTVFDPQKQEVVAGGTCTLSGAGTATVKTDDFGDFWFEGIEVGKYSVKIEAGGKTKTLSDISTEKDVNLGDIALS
jgi:tetrathionate reductase subunit B